MTVHRHSWNADAAGTPQRLIGPQREAFNVPGEIAYFNTASLAPQLHAVRAAGEAALERRGQPWRITASDWFADVERLRSTFAQIIDAGSDGVAIVPATSYGLAVAARNLPLAAAQRVLVLAEEYPSGIYTWRGAAKRSDAEILTVRREPGESWTDAVLAALDERVAIVSVPNVHWTDGALVDLNTIAERTREVGAALVIDGSQSVGAMPISMAELRPDYLVTVGYKWLLGPFSVGYLYVAEEHWDGEPLEENWINRARSEDFAALLDYQNAYQPGARRFDAGQRTKFELPRFHMHFTPTSSSWLNLVERWFAELTTKRLKRAAHRSVRALNADIRAWIETWNENPRPYVWTKPAERILESIARYCQRINQTAH